MYVEKRKHGKSIKYYLVYSYREKGEVKKIRRYLGLDLSNEELEKRKKEVEKDILTFTEKYNTKIFNFKLSNKQIKKLNEYDKLIKVHHLSETEWRLFTEEFVYNTNAIEGSGVELNEVKEILEKNKPAYDLDEEETKNVAKAVNFIRETNEDLSLRLILKLHKICFEGTKGFAGQFRNVNVVVRSSRGEIVHTGTPIHELNKALTDFIDEYNKIKKKFKPLILAAIVHNQFEHIHPFQDGNGRVGRLLLNFILIKNNYPPINILLEDRRDYYRTLEEYSKNHNLKPTLEFLVKQYKKMMKRVTTKTKK